MRAARGRSKRGKPGAEPPQPSIEEVPNIVEGYLPKVLSRWWHPTWSPRAGRSWDRVQLGLRKASLPRSSQYASLVSIPQQCRAGNEHVINRPNAPRWRSSLKSCQEVCETSQRLCKSVSRSENNERVRNEREDEETAEDALENSWFEKSFPSFWFIIAYGRK